MRRQRRSFAKRLCPSCNGIWTSKKPGRSNRGWDTRGPLLFSRNNHEEGWAIFKTGADKVFASAANRGQVLR